MSSRLLVLALDGANPRLVERWVADGALPTLGKLFAEGVSGRIRGLEGFFVGSTWPSLYTGVSPAVHGHHSLVQLRSGTYDYYRCADEGLVEGKPFWEQLGDCGRRVVVLDVPLSVPSAQVRGVQTVEWGSHDAVYGFATEPSLLADEIRQRFGEHPLGPTCDGSHRSLQDYRELLQRLMRGVRKKSELTRALLGGHEWDFAMQVFTESHCAGHQCWHLHDATHPAHDERIASAVGDPLRLVYREIDDAIGAILDDLPDAQLMVLSAHGMSHWYGAQFLLSEVLVRLGVAEPWPKPAPPSTARAVVDSVARWGWHRLPEPMKDRVRRARGALQRDSMPTLPVNAAKSLCFPVNNGLAVGGIRLNLRGREPEGRLSPGAEADDFCAQLAKDLTEIRDERNGLSAIRAVRRTADLYDGPRLRDLPDLLVEWNDALATGSEVVGGGVGARVQLRSPKIGTVEDVNRFGRTGEHRPDGFFVARLAGVAAQKLSEPVSLLDLAPTICALMGVDLASAAGKPITALVAR